MRPTDRHRHIHNIAFNIPSKWTVYPTNYETKILWNYQVNQKLIDHNKGVGKIHLYKGENIDILTQYSIAVQPSIVIHWNTVSIANPILSKLVIPKFGPTHFSTHVLVEKLQTYEPDGAIVVLSVLHGVSNSPSLTISSMESVTLILNDENVDVECCVLTYIF